MSERQVNKEGVVEMPKPYICFPRAPRSVPCDCGSDITYRHVVYIDDDGNQCAKRGEAIDMRAYKNASLEATDLANIKARFEAGDTSVINMRVGLSGDVTALPHDRQELEVLARKAENSFSMLPKEMQTLFGDYTGFFNSLLDGTTNVIIDKYYKEKKTPLVENDPQSEGGNE